jgi:deoxycytidine triphosphate deaminase
VILSDRDLRAEIEAGRLVIDPFDPTAVQPSSIDLRVGDEFRVFANHRYPHIDVRQPLDNLTEVVEATEDEPFILHPGEFVLGSTLETVTLPDNLVARLEGKSSLGRLGLLIHSSLPGTEPILFLRDGSLRQVPIEEIVRKRLYGSVVSFDRETFRIVYQEVTGWHETTADRIFHVRLASGRRIRLTGGHCLFTLDVEGDIKKARVHELAAGARVAVAGAIPDPPNVDSRLNLVDLAPEAAYRDLVCGGPSVGAAFRAFAREIAAKLRDARIAHSHYYRDRAELPLACVMQVPGLNALLGSRDWFSIRGGRHRLPVVLRVDGQLAWFMGLYVSQGARRHTQITISNHDQKILDRAQEGVERLGLPAYRSPGAVTCRSGLLARLVEWLGMGSSAREKRIPFMLLGWPEGLLSSFLDGVVDGNGAREATGVSLWTSSEGLVNDLMLLCERLGRRAGASLRHREGRKLWQISIPSQEDKLLTRVATCDHLGDLRWETVVAIEDTGAIEPVFDLEVRPSGRLTENFLAGYGGVFVSNTAGFVDAGFSGQLTLELSNVANLPIAIYPGMLVGQLCLFQMTSPAERPYGSKEMGSKYQAQRGPTPSRYHENFKG